MGAQAEPPRSRGGHQNWNKGVVPDEMVEVRCERTRIDTECPNVLTRISLDAASLITRRSIV